MPYPPPPPPPDVGEFQAIGKLPAPELPDVTGHGGEFLETDGIIPQWEPVSGVLPDQTGHAGEFLTTDGAVASWAPGGGGGGITTVGALTTATANAAIISGGDTLQLAPADGTNPGVTTASLQTLGGLKLFRDGAAVTVYDIRTYGAQPALDPADRTQAVFDCSDAFDAAIAAWSAVPSKMMFWPGGSSNLVGGIYVPTGTWYISRPLFLPQGCVLYGDDPQLSIIASGPGIPGESLVQGFGGPMIYLAGKNFPGTISPTYLSPLVGATGRSMKMWTYNNVDPIYPPSLCLEDCYAWSTYFSFYAAQVCLRFWLNIDANWNPLEGKHVIGFRSPTNLTPLNGALNISAITDGSGNVKLIANIYCQSTDGVKTITSGAVPIGTAFNVELDYNGSFFDFYIDGVNQGHVACTGRLYKRPWEVASVGDELSLLANVLSASVVGAIDSIELSDVARHTGTGGFTPPAAKYTADSHTLWLCNFDQGDPPVDAHGYIYPVMYAQTAQIKSGLPWTPMPWGTAQSPPDVGGLVKHHVRLSGWVLGNLPNVAQVKIKNLQLYPRWNNSGILLVGASRTRLETVWVYGASSYAFYNLNANSFYSEMKGCWSTAAGIGTIWYGHCKDIEDHFSGLGFWGLGGEYDNIAIQPEGNSFLPFAFGPAPDLFTPLYIRNCGNDEEVFGAGLFQELACTVIWDGGKITCLQNEWDISDARNPDMSPANRPVVMHILQGNIAPKHIGDAFTGLGGAVGQVAVRSAFSAIPTTYKIELENCAFQYSLPVSDIDGLVVVRHPDSVTNQKSLSAGDVAGNNLVGTFSILHGYTSGGPVFINVEPDANYEVQIQLRGYNGSAPAAGATEIIGYTTSTGGFVATVGVDPGSDCELEFSYLIVRTNGGPALDEYLPANPSSFTNPFAGEQNGLWAYGITLVPVTGSALRVNRSLGTQWIMGTGHSGTDDRYLDMPAGALPQFFVQSVPEGVLSAVAPSFGLIPSSAVVNNTLYSIWSPGPHNIAWAEQRNVIGAPGTLVWEIFIDGGNVSTIFPAGAEIPWTQQPTFYIGHDPLATLDDMTTVTTRHFKVGHTYDEVITKEQDSGPQAGMTISAFMGDDFLIGWYAGAAGLGGWATQIAEARYGSSKYYYFACNPNINSAQLVANFWQPWSESLNLASVVINSGYYGLMNGSGGTAVDEWAQLLLMLDGIYATAIINPPVANVNAWAFFISADEAARQANAVYTGAVGTCVINGVNITYSISSTIGQVPTMSSVAATVVNLVSAVNSAVGGVVTAIDAYTLNPTNHALYITAVVPELPEMQLPPPRTTPVGHFGIPQYRLGNTGTMGFGSNAVIKVNGTDFQWIFDTDADTTVNGMIALINADAPTAAVVTPTLSSHQLLLTAVAIGNAGDAVTVSSLSYYGSTMARGSPTLVGGVNGARTIIPDIILATVPPFGDNPLYTAGKETQRQAFNTLIRNYCTAHGGDGVVLLDIDATVKDGGDPTKIDATYLAADNIHLNDAGEAAVQVVADPLIP